MASKNDKTSKTAHVMNLLSKKPAPAVEAPTGTDESATPAAAAAPVPPIVTSMAPDVAVSAQIKNALEDALESELAASQPVRQEPAPQPEPEPEPKPVQQAAPAPQPEPIPEPAPVRQAKPVSQPEPQPTVKEEIPVDETPKFKEPLHPVNPGYVNVMQVLVEEKAPKYIKMFGLCTCERCTEDVKAYTLNHLPSKYVVMEPGDHIPRLTVYEGKFASDITAQLLQACKVVMEHPHHGR